MDDETLKRNIHRLLAIIVEQDQQIWGLTASVGVLKLAVAKLQGTAAESALSAFRDAEQKVLKQLPVSQKLQELRDLLEHRDDIGKHSA